MKRNNTVDFWRIIFIFAIICFHFFDKLTVFTKLHDLKNGWRIGVEFFLIVGGYLLAKTEEKRSEKAPTYLLHRVKRLYPEFFLMMLVYFPFFFWLNDFTWKAAIKKLLGNIDDFLLLNGNFANGDTLNGSMWYLSCMVLSGYVVYYLYHEHKRVFLQLIGPVALCLGYACLFTEVGKLGNYALIIKPFYISVGILRGFLGQTLGIYIYHLVKKLQALSLTTFSKFVLRITEPILYIGVLLYSLKEGSTGNDYCLLILLFIAITISFSGLTTMPLYNNRFITLLSKISFSIYLNHIMIRNYFLSKLDASINQISKLPVYLVCVVLFAIVMHLLYILLQKLFIRIQPKIKKLFIK